MIRHNYTRYSTEDLKRYTGLIAAEPWVSVVVRYLSRREADTYRTRPSVVCRRKHGAGPSAYFLLLEAPGKGEKELSPERRAALLRALITLGDLKADIDTDQWAEENPIRVMRRREEPRSAMSREERRFLRWYQSPYPLDGRFPSYRERASARRLTRRCKVQLVKLAGCYEASRMFHERYRAAAERELGIELPRAECFSDWLMRLADIIESDPQWREGCNRDLVISQAIGYLE